MSPARGCLTAVSGELTFVTSPHCFQLFCFKNERLKSNLHAVRCTAGECLDAVSGELTFFTLPNCFELFGFDLMVDDKWKVWLLEVRTLLCRFSLVRHHLLVQQSNAAV